MEIKLPDSGLQSNGTEPMKYSINKQRKFSPTRFALIKRACGDSLSLCDSGSDDKLNTSYAAGILLFDMIQSRNMEVNININYLYLYKIFLEEQKERLD